MMHKLFGIGIFLLSILYTSHGFHLTESLSVKNLYIGTDPGIKLDIEFNLNPLSLLIINKSLESHNTFHEQLYSHIFLSKYWHFFSSHTVSPNNNSVISIGWLALRTPSGVLFSNKQVQPLQDFNGLLGNGIPIENSVEETLRCVNLSVIMQSIQKVFKACLLLGSDILFLPQEFAPLDYTKNTCIVFQDLNNRTICTDQKIQGTSTFVIQLYNESYISIGTSIQDFNIGISQIENKQKLWLVWNELKTYTSVEIILLVGLLLILLLWSLIFCEENSSDAEYYYFSNGKQFLAITADVLVVLTIVYECLSRNLHFRIEYVITRFFPDTLLDIYETFIVATAILCVLINIILSLKTDISKPALLLHRNTLETLIVLALSSIFIGQTIIIEESVICLIIGVGWCFFQFFLMAKSDSLTLKAELGLFIVLYPFISLLLIEPFVRNFPDGVSNQSIWCSQFLILIPVVSFMAYGG